MNCLRVGPPWFNKTISLSVAGSVCRTRFCFIIAINLNVCFHYGAKIELGMHYASLTFYVFLWTLCKLYAYFDWLDAFVWTIHRGSGWRFVDSKRVLIPGSLCYRPFPGGGPGVILILFCFVVLLQGVSCWVLLFSLFARFCSVLVSIMIVITSLWKEMFLVHL